MNDQEKLQRVREQVARIILKNIWTSTQEQIAQKITDLPDIGVISDEQDVKFREFYNDWGGESGKLGYQQAVGDMKSTGFVRLIGRGE